MEKFWIFLMCFFLSVLSAKAQDTLTLHQTYPSFNDSEKAEWTSFLNNWNYFDYADLKEKHHVKSINCKSCESFYADVYVEIDAGGNITLAQCKTAQLCGITTKDVLLFSGFEASVRKQHYTSIKNKRFIVRLGQVLKC